MVTSFCSVSLTEIPSEIKNIYINFKTLKLPNFISRLTTVRGLDTIRVHGHTRFLVMLCF